MAGRSLRADQITSGEGTEEEEKKNEQKQKAVYHKKGNNAGYDEMFMCGKIWQHV